MIILLLMLMPIITSATHSPLNPHFLKRSPRKTLPLNAAPRTDTKITHQPPSGLHIPQETMQQLINSAAGSYAAGSIIWYCYQQHYTTDSHESNWLSRCIAYCTPTTIKSLYSYQQLLLFTLQITLKTLIFKAIAHCILWCMHGSLSDIIVSKKRRA